MSDGQEIGGTELTADAFERAIRAQEQIAAAYAQARSGWQAERRERIATAALTGMLGDSSASWSTYPPEISRIAVAIADALIAELDKEGKR